ncbi:hypothetical protein [Cereibacter azotoformans]|uniref:Uncharacterized protein n=1 Tax=Cereibacter azotoformans TaxID=43057 RepID=A0A2T5JSV6_9RHOB|nr:hypothetical protein [Cereibacter azotoformans]PTR11642.1 hypothetical protein C8J28_12634 [Cereibacter azotoformans]
MSAPVSEDAFDRVLLLLGRLNYVWSNTESLLIHLIAGLAGTTKDTALVIYLTLNTTRARADLVERLAKMEGRGAGERDRILELVGRLTQLAGLRNQYNHCIYAFDPQGGNPRTIQMRISDRRTGLRMGRETRIDAEAVRDIRDCIEDLTALNHAIWTLIRDAGYPA